MTILLTGADGFIGSYLHKYFSCNSIHVIPTYFKSVDLASDFEFKQFISKLDFSPDLIIHCASAARNTDLQYDHNSFTNNVSMFKNLALYALNSNTYLINLASGSDVDRKMWSGSIDDLAFLDYPPSTDDLHGYSKNFISSFIHCVSSKFLLNLRLFGVIGEGENYLQKLVPNTIAKLSFDIVPTIVQDRLYDYIDVHDLALFLHLLLDHIISDTWRLTNCSNLNFCSGKHSSILDIVTYISNQLNPSIRPIVLNSGIGKSYGGSTDLFTSLFPDFHFSPLTDCLDRQISFYENLGTIFSKDLLLDDPFLKHAQSINK